MGNQTSPHNFVAVEEHIHGEAKWVALRARGAEWSWLTPDEAVQIARQWIDQYGARAEPSADEKPERPGSSKGTATNTRKLQLV
jgi:hypothetical protein